MYTNRQEIIKAMTKADNIYKLEKSNEEYNINALNYSEMFNSVVWLEGHLGLKELAEELENSTEIGSNNHISYKQYQLFSESLAHLHSNRLGYSYHHICKFIEESTTDMKMPIVNIERVLLSVWVKSFISIYQKREKINKAKERLLALCDSIKTTLDSVEIMYNDIKKY